MGLVKRGSGSPVGNGNDLCLSLFSVLYNRRFGTQVPF